MADSAAAILSGDAPAQTTSATASGDTPAQTTTGVNLQAGTIQGGDQVANAKDAATGFDWKNAGGVTADEDIGYLQAKAYKTPADVLKALRGAEKLVGLDKLPMPKDDLDTEGWNRVYQRLGRPETAEKYDLGKLPDNADKEYIGHMLKAMHAAGASQKQVQAAFKAQIEYATQRETLASTERSTRDTEQLHSLKSEWGNGYQTQVEYGRRFMRENGIPTEFVDALEEKFGTAVVLKHYAKLGARFPEDKGPITNGTGDFGKMTPQQAKYQKSVLLADKDWSQKYTNGSPAERALTLKQMQELENAIAGTPL